MPPTRFVAILLGCGLLLALAACGSGSSSPPARTGPGGAGIGAGPPADALLVIAGPNVTHDVLSAALTQGGVKKYFLTSLSMDPASFNSLTLGDATVWGTQPAAPFAQADAFNAAYEDAYGHPASDVFGTAAMYDSVYVVALAAAQANTTDRAAIRDAISLVANAPGDITGYGTDAFAAARAALSESHDVNYIGASGQVDLDSNGEIAKSSVETWRVINGTIAPIETRDIDIAAEAGVELPAPTPGAPTATTPTADLHIGIIVPDDEGGTALSDAAKLAVSQINAAGGVWGKDVVLHVQTIGGPDQASHAAGLLITDDSVSAIIGPATTAAVSSALPAAAEANLALLALATDAGLSKLPDDKGELFRMVASDALQMPVLANLYLEGFATPAAQGSPAATGAAAGSVCVVFQKGDASQQMSEAFARAMSFKKATVRANVSFDPAFVDLDYAALLKDCIGS